MNALFDVQDSTLNSSLAEILANLAETEAGETSKRSGGRAAGGSPLLGGDEILSSSLQEFLKYEDPHSPIIPASFSVPRASQEPVEGAENDFPAAETTTPTARSPRFAMQRNPSFTPSLKGFLFSKDDGVVGRMETAASCSLTGSGSDSSDPALTYLPRLTDGSVSVLHSIENDLHDLSSLEDSIRSSDDTSSSNDRDRLTEVVDLGPVKEELEKNRRDREHEDRQNALDSPTPGLLNASKRKQSKSTGLDQRRVESSGGKGEQGTNLLSSCAVPTAARSPTSREARSKPHATVEKDIVLVPPAALIDADAQPMIATPSSPATEKLDPLPEMTTEALSKELEPPKTSPKPSLMTERQTVQVSERSTTEPSSTQPGPTKLSPKSPRRSSLDNASSSRSPKTSPSRRSASKSRRSSIGSSSSRPRRTSAPAPPSASNSSPKHRSKSALRRKDEVDDEMKSSEGDECLSPQVPGTVSSEEPSSRSPAGAPTSPTLSVSRTVELPRAPPTPTSPKSPHRELRLKIQIDELRSPKQAGDGVGRDGVGTEDEALPQMLKMLLDGVANKIRKHAKQESMRKIRSKEGSSSQDIESPARSVRQVVQSLTAAGTSESPKQRIKVRIDKSKSTSPRKDGNSASRSPSKSGRRRVLSSKPGENETDFDPHSIGKGDIVEDREPNRDPALSPRRRKERCGANERSRSRSSKSDNGTRDEHHPENDRSTQKGARPDSVKERPRRRSVDRETSSRRMSGAGHEERVRSKSTSIEKDQRSSRSRSKASTATSRSRAQRSDGNTEAPSTLKAKLDEGAEVHSRASGSRSVCSKSSRKRREEPYLEETKDGSNHRSSKATTSLANTLERGTTKQGGVSSSRSVCSRSSRKKREGFDEARLSRSHHSRSVHSSSKSVHSSSRSVHSTSKAASKSRTEGSMNETTGSPRLKSSASSHGSSDVTEAIEYDFNDDVPQKCGDSGDRRGRSFRRGSGSSNSRGRSLSARGLGSELDTSLKKSGRSQSQRQLQSDRASSLSNSRRSQSHRHLKSGEDAEYELGLGTESREASHHAARSSSQPPTSSRQALHESSRAESLDRSGARRSRSRPAAESRRELSLSGLSRSQIEEGAKSVASSASDRTPRRSGGRGPSPNARSRTQPTSLLSQVGKSALGPQAPEPPGRSPVAQTQVTTTVSRLRGVQKALSFRDMFAREPDPWQEFMSPTTKPKPSCLPVPGTTIPSTSTTTAPSTKGRSMPKFLSAVGSSFQRTASARFPEVTKSELDASFESFHPFETKGDGPVASDKRPAASAAATAGETVSSSSSASTTTSSKPPAPGPPPQRTQPTAISERSGHGWKQKFFR